MRRRNLRKLLVGLHLRARLALPGRPAARLAILAAAILAAPSAIDAADAARHPLDPLNAVEYRTVFTVLDAAGHAEETTFYPLIQLDEPAKTAVVGWRPGDAAPRRAFVVVMKEDGVFEAVVDLDERRLASWSEVEGVQPGILLSEEWALAQEIVRAHGPWREAISGRGVSDLAGVVPVPLTTGYFGDAREETDRLVKVIAFDGGGGDNYWSRPIEGLVALVSLDRGEVLELIDSGSAPIPEPADYDRDSVGPLRDASSPIILNAVRFVRVEPIGLGGLSPKLECLFFHRH